MWRGDGEYHANFYFFRSSPSRRHGGVRGLHFVGASTRPGNGVPLVLIGAEKTAQEALDDLEG